MSEPVEGLQLELAGCEGCGREIWVVPGVVLLCSRCELERPSTAELAFMARRGTRQGAAEAEKLREAWERENVVWFHGFAGGRAVWRSERPPPDADDPEPDD